jgi:hypothetical protein
VRPFCTIDPTRPGQVRVQFSNVIELIDAAATCFDMNDTRQLFDAGNSAFMTAFLELEQALRDADWVDKVRKSSRLSGHSITSRLLLLPETRGLKLMWFRSWQTNKRMSS